MSDVNNRGFGGYGFGELPWGGVEVWAPVPDAQGASWTPVNDTDSSVWAPVNDTQ